MKVHVILACFNGAEFLDVQLRSVLEQVDTDVCIHAYDDCSNDGTVEYLQALAAQDDRIVVHLSETPSGSAFANFRRAILSFSTRVEPGDLIAFCDQDDIWHLEKLSRQIEALHATRAVGCSTSVTAFYTDGRTSYINNAGRQKTYDCFFEGGGQGCTYLFEPAALQLLKSSLQVSADRSLQAVPHDWLLYAICRIMGLPWVILEEPLVQYRQHGTNAFGARSSIRGKLARFARLRSGHFAQERERLCQILRLTNSVDLSSVPEPLICRANFFRRLKVAILNFGEFRRTSTASVVLAVAFVCGKA